MAKEAIESVRRAEITAAQTEKDALKKREDIILKAKQQAEEIISAKTKQANEKAKEDMVAVQEKGTVLMTESEAKAKREIDKLTEVVKDKEQLAINFIISEIA